MSKVIVSVTEHVETAKALDLYIRIAMPGQIDSYYMTYHGALLSGTLIRQADLFIFELFSTDTVGPYTEGIHAAAKWISLGKHVLIVSGCACAELVQSSLYWDLAAADELKNRIETTLESPIPPPSVFDSIKKHFSKYYRTAEDPHK